MKQNRQSLHKSAEEKVLEEYVKALNIWRAEMLFKGDDIRIKAIQERDKRIIYILNKYENPYPRDIFKWDNKDKIKFNRGRFNQHCHEIVENIIKDIIKKVMDFK